MMEKFYWSIGNYGVLKIKDEDLSGKFGDKRNRNRSRVKDSIDG